MSKFFSSLPLHEEAALTVEPEERRPSNETEVLGRRHEAELLAIPGVEGFAPEPDHLVVYVADEQTIERLPAAIDGVPLRPVVTGPIRAL